MRAGGTGFLSTSTVFSHYSFRVLPYRMETEHVEYRKPQEKPVVLQSLSLAVIEQSRLGVKREMRVFYCQDSDSDGNRIRVRLHPLRGSALITHRCAHCPSFSNLSPSLRDLPYRIIRKPLSLVCLPPPWISLMNSRICPVLTVVDSLHQIEITANVCPQVACH